MTRAPANLLAVRSLLLEHLDNAPGTNDLEPAEVGIVGDPAHRGGYHCGSDRVDSDDYSVRESSRDRTGLTLDAAALDVGPFSVTKNGRTHNLQTFSVWCVAQCVAKAPDARDIREIIYSPDGEVVRRWDALGRRATGDDSHQWHTHFSFFRDAIRAGRDQRPLFRRYLQSIGLLEDDTMSEKAETEIHSVFAGMFNGGSSMGRAVDPDGGGAAKASNSVVAKLDYLLRQADALQAQVATLSGKDFTNEPAIIAGVLAGLTPEKIAAAIPATMAKQVAEELARRLVA